MDVRPFGRRRRRGAGKEKEHGSVVEKVAGAGNGELGGSSELEPNGGTLPDWAQAKPPGLKVDAFVPEVWDGCGDLHGDRAGDIEADEFIAGGRMRYFNGVSVDFDCEGG